ncbi:MAG: hypothetical protein GF384_03485 [Elusimicrobia bacterium]|nr:hypothetical protein [Elusimicrobiota bacterium]MBD3411976.1 hypothetical protein [Elusimicrobiota bacterium]
MRRFIFLIFIISNIQSLPCYSQFDCHYLAPPLVPNTISNLRLNSNTYDIQAISILDNAYALGRAAAREIIKEIRQHPDGVIIMPTGSTAVFMYEALVELYYHDPTIDFSQVSFFNLDEYIGIPQNHPLSYYTFMQQFFYKQIDWIDKKRAPKPENRYIPRPAQFSTPKKAAAAYNQMLQKTIAMTGRKKADLVVLGIGGAYPVYDRYHNYIGMNGGHIGFNEPGSQVSDTTRVVTLTAKTRLDTQFRFDNTAHYYHSKHTPFTFEVPQQAITLGIANILNSHTVLLMATGEEKAPVVQALFEHDPHTGFPATFLKFHPNLMCLFDTDAAQFLPHVRRPWQMNNNEHTFDKTIQRTAILEMLQTNPSFLLDELSVSHMRAVGIADTFHTLLDTMKQDGYTMLKGSIHNFVNNRLPQKGEQVLIFSPHPDDDVITMASSIMAMRKRGCDITIVYLTSGEYAVRTPTEYADQPYKTTKHYRIKTREKEARAAIDLIDPEQKIQLVFLNLPYYYHRGIPELEINDLIINMRTDIKMVRGILERTRPDHIFFSAEQDPHGTHGIGTEIIRQSLITSHLLTRKAIVLWGYRGAHQEWPLINPDDLVIYTFTEEYMNIKIDCIKAHASQRIPLFPGVDRRAFWERARDRNRATGRLLEQLGYCPDQQTPIYAETFKLYSVYDFCFGKSYTRHRTTEILMNNAPATNSPHNIRDFIVSCLVQSH